MEVGWGWAGHVDESELGVDRFALEAVDSPSVPFGCMYSVGRGMENHRRSSRTMRLVSRRWRVIVIE